MPLALQPPWWVPWCWAPATCGASARPRIGQLSRKNREGNFLTVAGRASDAIAADMAKSPANFLRDAVSTAMVVSLAPLSAILMIF